LRSCFPPCDRMTSAARLRIDGKAAKGVAAARHLAILHDAHPRNRRLLVHTASQSTPWCQASSAPTLTRRGRGAAVPRATEDCFATQADGLCGWTAGRRQCGGIPGLTSVRLDKDRRIVGQGLSFGEASCHLLHEERAHPRSV